VETDKSKHVGYDAVLSSPLAGGGSAPLSRLGNSEVEAAAAARRCEKILACTAHQVPSTSGSLHPCAWQLMLAPCTSKCLLHRAWLGTGGCMHLKVTHFLPPPCSAHSPEAPAAFFLRHLLHQSDCTA
jgi:hypothetical protein